MKNNLFKTLVLGLIATANLSAETSTLPSIDIFMEEEVAPTKDETIRRAVYDVNGSAIKVLVADVDLKNKKIEKLFSGKIDVGFRSDLMRSKAREFSDEIQAIAAASFLKLQQEIAKYQPQQSTVIVVDTFLLANNGQAMLDSLSSTLDLPLAVTSQKDKGELEFLSAIANNDAVAENTVVVDMCSMNAHITALDEEGEIVTFGKKLGYGMIDEYIAKKVRNLEKTPQDINPVTVEEALKTIDYLKLELNEMPEVLKRKLSSEASRFIATFSPVAKEKMWSKKDGWQFLQENILERKSEEPPLLTSKAIFIYTLVDLIDSGELELTGTDLLEGSASGVMVSEKYWK